MPKLTAKDLAILQLLHGKKKRATTKRKKTAASARRRRGKGLVGGAELSSLYNLELERALSGRGGAASDKIAVLKTDEKGNTSISYEQDPHSTPEYKNALKMAKALAKVSEKAKRDQEKLAKRKSALVDAKNMANQLAALGELSKAGPGLSATSVLGSGYGYRSRSRRR